MSLDPLLECDDLATTSVVVSRFGQGRIIGGRYKASREKSFRIVASVQPISGKDFETMASGRRARDLRTLWTGSELFTSDDKTSRQADLVTIDGQEYEVLEVESWSGLGLKHYKAHVARRNK